MRLEMVIKMQIEIPNGIMKLPFYGSFQIFKRKETQNNSFMIPFRISICIPMTISSLIFAGTGCNTHKRLLITLSYECILHSPHMGWLRSVGSIRLQVSFAEYRLFYRALLQKRPIILSILLIVATP